MLALDVEARNRVIGENLRRYRLLRGYTQDEVAEGLCSISQLSKVENGKTNLKPHLLRLLAERLGVTIEQLESADSMLDELKETLELGRSASFAEQTEKAFEYFCSVSQSARQHGYQTLFLEALLNECRLLNRRNEAQMVIERIEAVLAEQEAWEDDKVRVELLIELGKAHKLSGNMLMAHDCYCRADAEFEGVDEKSDSHLRTYYELADCHFYMSNFRTALRYIERAERLATELSCHWARIRACYYRATILLKIGEIEQAKGLFLTSLKEAQANELLFDVAAINNNLGCLHKSVNEHGLAIPYFQRSLQVFELLNQAQYLCDPYLQLAEIALHSHDVHKCNSYLDEVLAIVERLGNHHKMELARALQIRSWVEREAGQFEAYLDRSTEVLALYEQYGGQLAAYELAVELAEALDRHQDRRAVEYYRKAIELNRYLKAVGIRR
ncbi:helix-turn-helix domain-containing protein [Tumebacillus lipolyticus]|uniref:Helix-turn-helix domain-containing protein n=1 Tax=Tumebacillus lipolyticus TaxID=1280370 RepID=A0ABW4ZWC1_9BACL